MSFSSIPGYLDLKEKLISMVTLDRIPHSQLFIGSEGSVSLSIVVAFIKYLNCKKKQNNDSCNTCNSCNKINKFVHPDIYFSFPITKHSLNKNVKPTSLALRKEWCSFINQNPYACLYDWSKYLNSESKQFNIYKEEISEILNSTKICFGDYKFIVIWLPEYMNLSSANSLLKLLEEPPKGVYFVLITNNIEKIPITIISRMQKHFIKPLTNIQIQEILLKDLKIELSKSNEISNLCDGNMSQAIRLSNLDLNNNLENFKQWMRLCFSKNFIEIIKSAETFSKENNESQKIFFLYCIKMFRNTLLIKLKIDRELLFSNKEEIDFLIKMDKYLEYNKIENIIHELEENILKIERNINSNISFFKTSIFMAKSFI